MIRTRAASKVLLATCVATIFVSMPAHAVTPQQRAQGLTSEDLEANKKKLGDVVSQLTTSVSREKESRYKFDGMLSYGLRQDVALERSPILSTHRIVGVTSVTILDRPVISGFDDELASELVTLSLSASGQFVTIGQEIQGNINGGPMKSGDIDLSASRAFELDKLMNANNSLDLAVGSTIPFSDDSQFEGIVAAPYASLGWALGFAGGRYNLTQSVSMDYIVNRFSNSPITREVNADGSAGYSISTSARLGAGFRFTIGGGARLVRHLDDSVTAAYSNFQILSWTKSFATITLRHANGSRAEDHLSNFWFIDEYRRIISLSMSVRF